MQNSECMTRRGFIGLLATSAALALFGCAKGSPSASSDGASKVSGNLVGGDNEDNAGVDHSINSEFSNTEGATSAMTTPILVAYFSCTGTTQRIAEIVAESSDADLYRIIPKVAYTSEDLAYYTDCRADREQSDPAARPTIDNTSAQALPSIADYSTIILGYPIWHGQAPRIIDTFLESYDFTGKTILPFCTSGSSGIGSNESVLHEICPEAHWLEGRRLASDTTSSDIAEWLSEM